MCAHMYTLNQESVTAEHVSHKPRQASGAQAEPRPSLSSSSSFRQARHSSSSSDYPYGPHRGGEGRPLNSIRIRRSSTGSSYQEDYPGAREGGGCRPAIVGHMPATDTVLVLLLRPCAISWNPCVCCDKRCMFTRNTVLEFFLGTSGFGNRLVYFVRQSPKSAFYLISPLSRAEQFLASDLLFFTCCALLGSMFQNHIRRLNTRKSVYAE